MSESEIGPEAEVAPEAEGKKVAARRVESRERGEVLTQKLPDPNPSWFVPVMVGLMILGVLWIATFYITSGQWPVERLRYWNLGIGMGLLLAGFAMSTRWR